MNTPINEAGLAKLAAFGAMALNAHRSPYPEDVDGGTLQELAVKTGVLESRRVTEPCGESCACAEIGAIPGDCYFMPEDVISASAALQGESSDRDSQAVKK